MVENTLRRIVLFLDGTWNADDGKSMPTNIVRMHEALKIGVDAKRRMRAAPGPGPSAQGSFVPQSGGKDVEYVVHYDSGVGTGALDRLPGGALGRGLDDNIREAYRFLSKHYRDGDEIHVFGFSRGAFTARSVVGYLFATGLLKAEECTSAREEQAWKHYRTSPDDRHCGDWYALKPFLHDPDRLKVKSVGVYDTVGALGIPMDLFRQFNTERYAFHNTELSSIVEHSFHAVAIDEHRRSFEATLWRKPKFKEYHNATVEQVWFAGAHADIGGGYSDWDNGEQGRQDIAYAWMVQRLIACTELDFAAPAPAGAPAQNCNSKAAALQDIHRPWGVLNKVRPQACRAINQIAPNDSRGVPLPGRGTMVVGLTRHADPIGEMIHISALVLLADTAGVRWENIDGPHLYRPPNLVAVLPLIASSYQAWNPAAWKGWEPLANVLARERPIRRLYVVDWDGSVVPAAPPQPAGAAQPADVFQYLGNNPAAFGLKLVAAAPPVAQP